MLSRVFGGTVVGIDGRLIAVEVDISVGLPAFDVVGLPDAAVRESKERVRSALRNAGYDFPLRRITVSLAPASLRKAGSGLDLPIALGVLAATGQIPQSALWGAAVLGELGLDGSLGRVCGALPIAMACREAGVRRLVLPLENAAEAALVDGIEVMAAPSLGAAVEMLMGQRPAPPVPSAESGATDGVQAPRDLPDFADVRGQAFAKRGIEIAVAGGHNLLMVGPPGSGKTMLARCIPALLPPLTREEALEVTRIYSVLGLVPSGQGLITRRPFRAPHHTVTRAGLVGGGGPQPMPGEVTLAHRGVLFLDEMAEFSPYVIDALRQPLEDGVVTIPRAGLAVTYPARFMLVGGTNPCRCGFLGDARRECTCTPREIARYRSRISGPVMDRIDIHLEVLRPNPEAIAFDGAKEEPSAVVAARVRQAREVQAWRFAGLSAATNAEMGPRELSKFCVLSASARSLLASAASRMSLSPRAITRTLKVARTIADLAGSARIEDTHIAEALQYRLVETWQTRAV